MAERARRARPTSLALIYVVPALEQSEILNLNSVVERTKAQGLGAPLKTKKGAAYECKRPFDEKERVRDQYPPPIL
jgi:hypothetical protein